MPRSEFADYIASLLQKGAFCIGEVHVAPDLSLSHREDVSRGDLDVSTDPWHALEIARYDDEGRYRPLKTAANLQHGWRLSLASSGEVLAALDFLYPATLAMAYAEQSGTLVATPLRATLERQTGMYAVVKKITNDQAREVVSQLCNGEVPCLRRKLWNLESPQPPLDSEECEHPAGPRLPLLCAEACNLFVAAGRRVVKREATPQPSD